MNEDEQLQFYHKMGFHKDNKEKTKLNCPKCGSIDAANTGEREDEITDSHRFTKRLTLVCRDCGSDVIGADI